MAKKKKGGNKQNGEEDPPMEVLEALYPKRISSTGIPMYKQFLERIEQHLEDDADME